PSLKYAQIIHSSGALRTHKNRTEVLCPRVTQAAMIAAASFGLRRSGRFATATSGAAYWAASVRHGPPWPLPVNAPKSIFQNSILYRARTQWAPLLLPENHIPGSPVG